MGKEIGGVLDRKGNAVDHLYLGIGGAGGMIAGTGMGLRHSWGRATHAMKESLGEGKHPGVVRVFE